jgi:hypothetical protein
MVAFVTTHDVGDVLLNALQSMRTEAFPECFPLRAAAGLAVRRKTATPAQISARRDRGMWASYDDEALRPPTKS